MMLLPAQGEHGDARVLRDCAPLPSIQRNLTGCHGGTAGGSYGGLNGMGLMAHGAAPLVRGTSLGSGSQWGHGVDGAMPSQYMLPTVSHSSHPIPMRNCCQPALQTAHASAVRNSPMPVSFATQAGTQM